MLARIYRPAKGATSSGSGRSKTWMLEFERSMAREIEPLMGWTSSNEPSSQVRIPFDTKEEAVAFIEKLGIAYRVEEPKPDAVRRGLSYSDNFKHSRAGMWTH
jgi:hypothetical protein